MAQTDLTERLSHVNNVIHWLMSRHIAVTLCICQDATCRLRTRCAFLWLKRFLRSTVQVLDKFPSSILPYLPFCAMIWNTYMKLVRVSSFLRQRSSSNLHNTWHKWWIWYNCVNILTADVKGCACLADLLLRKCSMLYCQIHHKGFQK